MLQNKDLSMIIIIPDAINGLRALVEGLANSTVKDIKESGYSSRIDSLRLPKFQIESTLSLEGPLQEVIFIHWLLKFSWLSIFALFLTE